MVTVRTQRRPLEFLRKTKDEVRNYERGIWNPLKAAKGVNSLSSANQ